MPQPVLSHPFFVPTIPWRGCLAVCSFKVSSMFTHVLTLKAFVVDAKSKSDLPHVT